MWQLNRLLHPHTSPLSVGRHGRWPATLAAAGLITFICIRGAIWLSYPEFALLDAWMRLRPARTPSPEIVLVGIEESDPRAFADDKTKAPTCTCMLQCRTDTARLIRDIKQAGARVVGIDMIFELPCPEHDGPLLEALRAPGETVIMAGTNPVPGKFNFKQMEALEELSELYHPIIASPVLYSPRGIIRGVQLIQREELPETVFRTGRTSPNAFPPFALACYAAFRGRGEEVPEELGQDQVQCADITIPVRYSESVQLLKPVQSEDQVSQNKYNMLINWTGRAGTFPTYSMATITDLSPGQRRRLLRDKIVLIGSMADRQSTPMWRRHPDEGPMSAPTSVPVIDQRADESLTGLEVHANALDTVLRKRFVRDLAHPLMGGYLLAVSLLTLLIFRRVADWRALAFTGGLVAANFLLAGHLMRLDYWIYSVAPAVAIGLSGISGAVLAFAAAREETGELARSIEARDSVTSTIAHDFKQPLTAINALAQVLRNEQLRADGKISLEVIERIQKQVQMALGDIDELLTVDPQRILHLDRKHFDLAALARDLAVPQSLKTGLHKVEVQAPEEGVWVTADPRYLGRALSNLMDNATKYWPSGGTVIVEMKREPGRVSTRIIDHGIGIPREAQQRLFNRFQRAVPAELDIPGTGIGLYSVRRIIEAHGGSVELISAPGEGSIFILNLPDEPPAGPPNEGMSQPC